MFKDLQFAMRGLLKKPAFAAIAVLTLTLGIGANTAIFSVVNAVLLRPLALKDPDRLMTFRHSAPAKGLAHMDVNDELFAYYRERTRTFEGLAAFETGELFGISAIRGRLQRSRCCSSGLRCWRVTCRRDARREWIRWKRLDRNRLIGPRGPIEG